MRGFRPPASVSRNSTSVTCQGSTSCRAVVNSIVVSIPSKLPDRCHRLTRFTHTKQRKAAKSNVTDSRTQFTSHSTTICA